MLILIFIVSVNACVSNSSCGCGGVCEMGVCTTLGDICNVNEPYCDTNNINHNKCVECLNSDHCSGNKKYCIEGVCHECSIDSECASDTDCDVYCDNYSCIHSNVEELNCKKQGLKCFIGNRFCVECNSNNDCGSGRLCNLATRTCEVCKFDEQCRSDDECNAYCNVTSGSCELPSILLNCNGNLRCNKQTAKCVDCLDNGDCLSNIFLTTCNTSSNTCHQCLTDVDCRSDYNCNAKCAVIYKLNRPINICRNDVSGVLSCCDGKKCDLDWGGGGGVCVSSSSFSKMMHFSLFYVAIIVFLASIT